MEFLITYQWQIFIIAEILSFVSLLLFGVFRYFLDKKNLSTLFIFGFLFFLFVEAVLALMIYQRTGEFSTFQIVIAVFLLYACTFGIIDFKRLDRWMRKKIGGWRGIELLAEKDYTILKRNNDPKYLARKYRWTSTIHLIVFLIVQSIFWTLGTNSIEEMIGYLRDFSWVESGTSENTPYPNDTLYAVGTIWGIIFAVDFIWSWSYTLFPAKQKDNI